MERIFRLLKSWFFLTLKLNARQKPVKLKKILISKNSVLFAFFIQWRKSGLLLSNPLESCNMDGGIGGHKSVNR